MRIDHHLLPLLKFTVSLVTDDFGNEINLTCPFWMPGKPIQHHYKTFDAAKRHIYGLSFEEMKFQTIYPVAEEH